MRKICAFSALLLSVLFLLPACGGKDNPQEEPSEPKSAEVETNLSIESEVLGRSIMYSICFPPEYDSSKSYPVLYLLHGYEFNATDLYYAHNGWINNANLKKQVSTYLEDEGGVPFLVVTPNGQNDFYRDGYVAGMNYETFFEEEFIPLIENKYKGNGKRAIAGLSMGGYGSLYHGIKYPSKFSYIYACSPATSSGLNPDLTAIVDSADPSKIPPITIETGMDDIMVSYSSVQTFCRNLDIHSIAYSFNGRSGGHDWPFWTACLPKILKKTGASFAP